MKSGKHVVFAWELGSNYGHIAKNLSLARPLLEQGCQVSFVLRDLSYLYQLEVPSEVKVYQAPVMSGYANNDAPNNYSDILLGIGYNNLQQLSGVFRGWVTLLREIQPNLVICDHAPTALIAAKIISVPMVNFGTGFEVPEPQTPFASIRLWEKVAQNKLLASDNTLLDQVNKALATLNFKTYSSLKSLFSSTDNFLCSLPEIDPYIGRKNTPYWGPMMEVDMGSAPQWPVGKDLKVFVYIRSDLKMIANLLNALGALKLSVIIHYIGGGSPPAFSGKNDWNNIDVSPKPLKMSKIMDEADLIICHAGHGTVANALLNGVPLLLLPTQQEQKNTTIRLTNLGIALELKGDESVMQLRKKLNRFIKNKIFKENAQVIKDKYSDFDLSGQVVQIAQRCIELCR